MIRRPPRSTLSSSSAASDVYKRQLTGHASSGESEPRLQAHWPRLLGVDGNRQANTAQYIARKQRLGSPSDLGIREREFDPVPPPKCHSDRFVCSSDRVVLIRISRRRSDSISDP